MGKKPVIKKVCQDFKIKLVDVSVQTDYPKIVNMPIDEFINKSFSIGNEVILGIYDNPELKVLSFFHEVAHTLPEDKSGISLYEAERLAWKNGVKIANKYGITFSLKSLRWAITALKTYKKYEFL